MKPITTQVDVISARSTLKFTPKEMGIALGVTTFVVNVAEKTGQFSLTFALALECLLRRASKQGYQRLTPEDIAARTLAREMAKAEALAALPPKPAPPPRQPSERERARIRAQTHRDWILEDREGRVSGELKRAHEWAEWWTAEDGPFSPRLMQEADAKERAERVHPRVSLWIAHVRAFGVSPPLTRADIYSGPTISRPTQESD